MSALQTLARMLGVAPRLAEDARFSERAARAALSRRNLFAAAGAMAAGTVFAQVRGIGYHYVVFYNSQEVVRGWADCTDTDMSFWYSDYTHATDEALKIVRDHLESLRERQALLLA